MFFTLNSRKQAFLPRLLQTTGLSLAVMIASAAGVHAEDVTVHGANGVNGFDNFDPFALAGPGGGAFAIRGAVPRKVPEASSLAMLVLGFAGLGFVGYRQTGAVTPQAA